MSTALRGEGMIAVLWIRGRPYFKVPALLVPDPPPPTLMIPGRKPGFPGRRLPVEDSFEYVEHVFELRQRAPSYGLAHYVHVTEKRPGTAQLEADLRRGFETADEETLAIYALLLRQAEEVNAERLAALERQTV